MIQSRVNRLFEQMKAAGCQALVLNPGPTLTYLTGLNFHLMERPTILMAALPNELAIVLPELETGKLAGAPKSLKVFAFGDNPATWGEVFRQACQSMAFDGQRVGVEPNRLRFLELSFLQQAAPAARFESAAGLLESLRMQKDAGEVAAMRKAVEIAQKALQATLAQARVGMLEREVAAELTMQTLRFGGDPELPFAPIVGSGPNSANPHYSPGERPLTPGDLVVIDWGAFYHGYVSDLTRTFAVGTVEPELRKIAQITAEANAAGRAVARPGLRAGDVDKAARAVIEKAGYGPQFFHRTGHGIGMEGHEPPYMFGENDLILQEGMAFTVEPGIYLTGRGGVRVEDNVVITAQGAETLSDLPRELLAIG